MNQLNVFEKFCVFIYFLEEQHFSSRIQEIEKNMLMDQKYRKKIVEKYGKRAESLMKKWRDVLNKGGV